MDLSDLGNLGDLAKQMQDAYGQGLDSMNEAGNEAGKVAAEDMNPDHEIILDIKISAKVESHIYKVDAIVTFDIELNPILESNSGDLAKALDGLNMDLGEDKAAVMEQLSQPRAIGAVKNIKVNDLEVHNSEGKVESDLNKDGSLLATLKDGKFLINCESVFSFPNDTELFVAIPSMEKMQENIVIDLNNKSKEVKFSWKEEDKDNLKISGKVKLTEK